METLTGVAKMDAAAELNMTGAQHATMASVWARVIDGIKYYGDIARAYDDVFGAGKHAEFVGGLYDALRAKGGAQ